MTKDRITGLEDAVRIYSDAVEEMEDNGLYGEGFGVVSDLARAAINLCASGEARSLLNVKYDSMMNTPVRLPRESSPYNFEAAVNARTSDRLESLREMQKARTELVKILSAEGSDAQGAAVPQMGFEGKITHVFLKECLDEALAGNPENITKVNANLKALGWGPEKLIRVCGQLDQSRLTAQKNTTLLLAYFDLSEPAIWTQYQDLQERGDVLNPSQEQGLFAGAINKAYRENPVMTRQISRNVSAIANSTSLPRELSIAEELVSDSIKNATISALLTYDLRQAKDLGTYKALEKQGLVESSAAGVFECIKAAVKTADNNPSCLEKIKENADILGWRGQGVANIFLAASDQPTVSTFDRREWDRLHPPDKVPDIFFPSAIPGSFRTTGKGGGRRP